MINQTVYSQLLNRKIKLQRIMKSVLSASLFLAILLSDAAEAQTPAPPQHEPVALEGGTIHTISGDIIENGTVLFENGVITALGTNVDLPEGTRIEDVSGK